MKQQGFTLLELMVVVAIAIIMMGIGVPAMTDLYQSLAAEGSVNRIMREVKFARGQAINLNQRVVICALQTDGSTCGGNGSDGLTVFADDNQDGKLSAGETTLQAASPFSEIGEVGFKGSKTAISFQADGLAIAFGSLYFCSANDDYIAGVIVSMGGNSRFATSTETSTCPF